MYEYAGGKTGYCVFIIVCRYEWIHVNQQQQQQPTGNNTTPSHLSVLDDGEMSSDQYSESKSDFTLSLDVFICYLTVKPHATHGICV